jgi:hypothetical protein
MTEKVVWTEQDVELELKQAADVIRVLPEPGVRGYYNLWPEILRDSFESRRTSEGPPLPARPSPRNITKMEAALEWLRCLSREDQRLVWARVNGARWKTICWEFGIHRSTASFRYRRALFAIAVTINQVKMSRHQSARHSDPPWL